MKILLLFLLLIAAPSVSVAEDVQVRIYSAHPPDAVTILATKEVLRWKSCVTCPEQTSPKLSVKSSQGAADAGDSLKEFFVSGNYKLQPEHAPVFSANFPLRIEKQAGGLVIVITMPVEQYVQHVLMAESGDFQNAEALKAMAVAARSYAKKFSRQHAKEGFDFCDTTHCQVFSWKSVNERIRTASKATEGETVSYQGKPAATYYHQNCGGTLAAASEAWAQVAEPYLTVHSDPFCVTSGGLHWETSLTHEQIDHALQTAGLQTPENWQAIEISSRYASGRVHNVNLAGGSPTNFSLSASSLRFAVDRVFGWNNIRSDLYEIRNSSDKVLFSGRGSGHGVGLCQAGAEEMAREGKSYREILSFYYPGTQLAAAPAKENWQKRSDERFDLISSNPDDDSEIFPVAERLLREAENNTGWHLSFRVRLQIYSSLDSYRNTTGQPGWVAASTRGQTIRLQPLGELRRRSVLESTLRHELYHLLLETKASLTAPLWLREGLVLYLSGSSAPNTSVNASATSSLSLEQIEQILKRPDSQENAQKAYASACRIVAALVQKYGRQTILSWLSDGLPADATLGVSGVSTQAPRN